MTSDLPGDDRVPEACTLPTAEQPLRRAEFDELFANDVLAIRRESPQRLRLELRAEPETASRAAALAVKETGCCAFFTFDLAIADGAVSLRIETDPTHEAVLAGIVGRAESRIAAAP
jgi:hypothetical protein